MTHKSHERIAIYPGTFDPFTVGHMSIVERGLKIFDRIIIAIGVNESKKSYLPVATRMTHIAKVIEDIPNVEVISYQGLTVDVAKKYDAQFILRGVRTVGDFEYEKNLAYANCQISGIETVLLYTLPHLAFISSTLVRDLHRNGHDITDFVPKAHYLD